MKTRLTFALKKVHGTIFKLSVSMVMTIILFTNASCAQQQDPQITATKELIHRILPEYSDVFTLQLIEKEDGKDVFEIEPYGDKIVISGSSGIALSTGFNHYLKNYCNVLYTWRGENLQMPEELPLDFEKVRKVTPHQYRYMFNYCTFGYSTAFWHWEDWEKIIDWMAMNGINMPLAIAGQEIIWQRVFEKHGLTKKDMEDFFVGPAYNAWGRMGGLDGYGGPLPQTWIEQETALQHKILERERSFGMTPILQGFAGHIPKAFVEKNKDVKVHKLSWCDFPKTNLLDWEEPLFTEIATDFINEMTKEYGTDHYYAIDPFNEMNPTKSDLDYLENMGASLFKGMNASDEKGKWLLMTWTFKNPEIETGFWKPERTKAFFDGIPDDRVIALELYGESWHYTGWHKLDSYYGKPWVWGVIQNFGDRVGMYGDLSTIVENYKKVLESPNKGNISGLGLFMEGLGYNPIIYELMGDMMWEDKPIDIEQWKWKYLERRYGKITPEVKKAWENIFDYFYTKEGLFTGTMILSRPNFNVGDQRPHTKVVEACKQLLAASKDLKDNDAYQFDLVNLFREAFGAYASHILYEARVAFEAKNIKEFEAKSQAFIDYILEVDALLGTREEFLLGKWVNDARSHGTTEEESDLYEWNAKSLISLWGPKGHPGCGGLYGYAMKQWSGFFSDYSLPSWKLFFEEQLKVLKGNTSYNHGEFIAGIMDNEEAWLSERGNYNAEPVGNSIDLATKLWDKYSEDLVGYTKSVETPPGIAVNKKAIASSDEGAGHTADKAVDGNIDINSAWWAAPYPQNLIVDLEKEETVFGFQVYPYWDWVRYYQYDIEVSSDNKKWSKVVDMSQNTKPSTPEGFKHLFKIRFPEGVKCRYVRLNMLYNSTNEGVHVVELKVFRGGDL